MLILSGPTHEYIDPVRFIGNASSGRMGCALAVEAAARGFAVDFVTGPVPEANLPPAGDALRIVRVISAADMLNAARGLSERADIMIFAAAVADYTPVETLHDKLPKTSGLTLQLVATEDIAATLCAAKRAGQTAIGFALQTGDGEAQARRKLAAKQLDGIVLNTPATLGAPDGTFSFLARGQETFEAWGRIDKAACARHILDTVQNGCGSHHP